MRGLIAFLFGSATFILALAVYAYRNPPVKKQVSSDAPQPGNRRLTQRQETLLWGLGAVTVAILVGRAIFGAWTMGLLFILVGAGVPGWVVHRRQERKRAKMAEQLEQLMGRLANTMAGTNATPEMAWLEAAAEVPEPLGSVLREIANGLLVGRALDEALHEQSRYLGIPEFELVAMSTSVLSGMGGNLAESYRRVGDTIAARRSARATLLALTMETKLNGHIVSAVPFIAFASLRVIVPDYVQPILSSAAGLIVLGLSSALVLGGWGWMLRIADVERLE